MSGARLLLHVGMDKTGSTAIQGAYEGVRSGPVRWPASARRVQTLLIRAFDRADGDATARSELRDLLAASAAHGGTTVVSHEGMSRWKPERIAAALSDWRPLFPEIAALAYLRAPLPYLTSRIAQRVKLWPLPEALAQERPRYRMRLRPWEEALGPDAVDYALYDRDALADGDVVADFARRTGLPPRADAVANTSLSAEAVAVLAVYRAAVGREPRDHGYADPRPPVEPVLAGFGETRFRLAPACLPADEDHAKQVAWAEGRLGRAFPDPADPSGFASPAEILAFGDAQGPALRDWAAGHGLADLPPATDVPALVEALRVASEGPPLVSRGWWRRILAGRT